MENKHTDVNEMVKIVAPTTPDNMSGYIVVRKGDMKPGDVLFQGKDWKSDTKDEPTVAPRTVTAGADLINTPPKHGVNAVPRPATPVFDGKPTPNYDGEK